MMNKFSLSFITVLAFVVVTSAAFAGDNDEKQVITSSTTRPAFRAGGMEVELRGGAYFSFLNKSVSRPALNYAYESLSIGWMYDDIYATNFWRGNDELLFTGFAGEVFKGPGTALWGGELTVRHNFVQPDWRLIPYVEVGGGALGNDIFHSQPQHLIGEDFEFMLHAAIGAKYMINNHVAISVEGAYRHISDAGLSSRNDGLNSVGGTLGLSWLY